MSETWVSAKTGLITQKWPDPVVPCAMLLLLEHILFHTQLLVKPTFGNTWCLPSFVLWGPKTMRDGGKGDEKLLFGMLLGVWWWIYWLSSGSPKQFAYSYNTNPFMTYHTKDAKPTLTAFFPKIGRPILVSFTIFARRQRPSEMKVSLNFFRRSARRGREHEGIDQSFREVFYHMPYCSKVKSRSKGTRFGQPLTAACAVCHISFGSSPDSSGDVNVEERAGGGSTFGWEVARAEVPVWSSGLTAWWDDSTVYFLWK